MGRFSVKRDAIGGAVFALSVGITLAWFSFQWTTESEPRQAQRAAEEAIVLEARKHLTRALGDGSSSADSALQIADPLQPNRVAGKVFIYPVDAGWEVSGHYRRRGREQWRPWIMALDDDGNMLRLSAQTPEGTLELPPPP